MKSLLIMLMTTVLLLTACAPTFDKQEEVVQETEETNEKAIIPRYNISESYYRTILPFKPGEARGLVVRNLQTRLDITEFETGLMRIAQESFSSDQYFYQEGQKISKETIESWLNRKMSPAQLQEDNKKEAENLGLNPIFEYNANSEESYETQMSKSPIYLAHMLEHNYLIKNKDGKVELGGVVIGLALNSVQYFNLPDDQGGYPREVKIDTDVLKKEGKRIAEEVLARLRTMDELKNVPIVIALFEQEEISSIAPGNFIAKTGVINKGNRIDKWEDVNEEYHFFPSTAATNAYREDAVMFTNFKTDIDEFFPNYTGVIGRGFYKNEELYQLTIEIPMQFYGKAEVIGFTQFITGEVMEHFPDYFSLQVYVSSENGPESIIVRNAGEEEPFVHIYN
ncbi:CamS family sex pheromone protein [Cytobacillus sp. S13-E01]|uniref:CamS family sex pheromone protein n=1 Tax=Cytobacillus sp. S13-E01 TaxID=3031326 RepID=UPI0023D7F963|nr:CamS family sex pheromone protein [Cytobacillus sp. S13-E01]MDF0728810.1 CamS family sex pheromone protein [Cytobacillus sp. S13-E01]